jgi:hypothetical protein
MNQRLIIFTVPPPVTLRDQDSEDLEMLLAGLRLREGANFTNTDEFGPLSGDRWHTVLRRFLDRATGSERKVEAAELEYLVKLLAKNGTTRPGTERRWAVILGRFIRDDYDVSTGRRKQDVRDRLVSRHYWLLRRIHPNLSENDCAESVALTVADAGGKLSEARTKRIAKAAKNKKAALQWIDAQLTAFASRAPDVVERALLATFEPLISDRKLLTSLSRQEGK